jgi:hypothetical protein
LRQGAIVARTYTSRPLGLRVPVPEGFEPSPTTFELTLRRREPSAAVGTINVDLIEANAANADAFAKGVLDAFGDDGSLGRARWADAKMSEVVLPLGRARVYAATSSKKWQLRVVVAPMCGGRGSLRVFAIARDASAQAAIDRWLHDIELTEPSAVCAYLATNE